MSNEHRRLFLSAGSLRPLYVLAVLLPLLPKNGDAQTIQVGSATGVRGEQVTISVTLATGGRNVINAQNDITVTGYTPFAVRSDGSPDCTVNPAIGKDDSEFFFLPRGCTGTGCVSVSALIFDNDLLSAIVDGAVLYSCKINISAAAQTNTSYPLFASGVILADELGDRIPDAAGQDGQVNVLGDGC